MVHLLLGTHMDGRGTTELITDGPSASTAGSACTCGRTMKVERYDRALSNCP